MRIANNLSENVSSQPVRYCASVPPELNPQLVAPAEGAFIEIIINSSVPDSPKNVACGRFLENAIYDTGIGGSAQRRRDVRV